MGGVGEWDGGLYEITFAPTVFINSGLWLFGAKKSLNFGFPRGSWSRVGKSFNSKLLLVSSLANCLTNRQTLQLQAAHQCLREAPCKKDVFSNSILPFNPLPGLKTHPLI